MQLCYSDPKKSIIQTVYNPRSWTQDEEERKNIFMKDLWANLACC